MNNLNQRIEPFRGLLYDPVKCHSLSQVVAPPYDLIGPARQDELYDRSPFNVVRLELNREKDPYSAAATGLKEWRSAGILRRADLPAIYHYSQEFEVGGRQLRREGFIVRIRLEEFSQGRILPHERTFAAAKEDRLRLLSAARTNLSPIFGLYSGKHAALEQLKETVAARPALFDLVDDLKIRNQLRVIDAPGEIAVIQRALEKPRVLIADGHHRYETALTYRQLRRQADSNPVDPQPYDYAMMTLCGCDDPGLVILPTHRVVKDLPPEQVRSFAARASESFVVEKCEGAEVLMTRLKAAGRGALGVALGSDRWLLRLKELTAMAAAAPDLPAEIRELDVSVLHILVFERLLGLPESEVKRGVVEYTVDAPAAFAAVAAGKAAGAFVMNPPSIRDVERVSDAGVTMPHKSTYFYPKLLTGLVLNPLDD